MEKIVHLQHFRYQLSPLHSDTSQVKMFNELSESKEEIIRKKNDYFAQVIEKLAESSDDKFIYQIHFSEGVHFVLKIGQKKSTTISTEKLVEQKIENFPFSYVIIDNNPDNQKIVIGDNTIAFSTPTVLANQLASVLRDLLLPFGLNIEIDALFHEKDFWQFVGKNPNITKINFKFVKPNMARISKSLPEAFRAAVEQTNSHTSNLIFHAPEKGVLENIKESNPTVNGLVHYASEGGGTIKIKFKGKRKEINTSTLPVKSEVTQLELEGSPNALIKFFKDITKL